ncbi:MAG TPA: helix-turn-helix transcriptional regulator [Candidatus Saccharimonadales bacterium]|nr:helix-turn-helix transcriptional regulator [Candidatus Saccharimonadales bacterium]
MSANTIHDSPFDKLVANPAHPVDTQPPHPGLAEEELRRQFLEFRTAAGLTQGDVQKYFDWSKSKLHRIENGPTPIGVADARNMLQMYGIKDETFSELIEKTRFVKDLHKREGDDLFSKAETSFLKHEAEASAVRIYEPDFLPDVMQPLEYAHALARVLKPGVDSERARDLDDFRLNRAAYLLGQYGPKLHVILDETVLHRAIGGEKLSDSDPTKYSVMALAINGLRSLHSTGSSNDTTGAKNGQLNLHITIQVVPYEAGPYPLMNYPYSILDMPDDDNEQIVYVNGNLHGQSNDGLSKAQTASYVEAFDELAQRIPGADQTEDILKWVLDSYAS